MVFLNYLYYSKHLHILLAFPNTYYASVKPKGQLDNLESVTKEVMLMMDPNVDPFAVPEENDDKGSLQRHLTRQRSSFKNISTYNGSLMIKLLA